MKTAATVALRTLPRAALALPPGLRRGLAIAFATLAVLAALYMGWFRDSSFAQVQKVEISGLNGPQARSIREALTEAGLGMTTLHVRDGDLRDAVAAYPVVRAVTASGDFPHVLRIEVELNLPVAAIPTPGGRIAVTADGVLLHDVPTSGLATLGARGPVVPDRIIGGRAFSLLRVVATAPELLRVRIRAVEFRAKGIVAHLRRGPDLIFGTADRMAAKWIAAARVLASPAAKGASYIDVRLPERPAAGGLATTGVLPLAPAGPAADAPQPPGTTATTPTTATTTPTQPTTTATQTTTTTTTTTPQSTSTTPAAAPQTTPTTAPPGTTGGGQQAPP